MVTRFLALPLRPALSGVTWASLSVSILPTEEQKRARREAARQYELLDLVKPEKRPPLHPLGAQRLPVERLYFWFNSPSKSGPMPFG